MNYKQLNNYRFTKVLRLGKVNDNYQRLRHLHTHFLCGYWYTHSTEGYFKGKSELQHFQWTKSQEVESIFIQAVLVSSKDFFKNIFFEWTREFCVFNIHFSKLETITYATLLESEKQLKSEQQHRWVLLLKTGLVFNQIWIELPINIIPTHSTIYRN